MLIGFSTGAVAFGDFERALKLLEPTDATAVELSAMRSVELPDLLNALPSRLKMLNERYRYISFHAPIDFNDERHTVLQLSLVAEMGINVVVHPDTLNDIKLWRALGSRLCIENMDTRKSTGRTVAELGHFFDVLPCSKLCFDIEHARDVDPTMTEATRILTMFGNRLVHVHLNGRKSSGKRFNDFFPTGQAEAFGEALSKLPLIIESIVDESKIAATIVDAGKVLHHPCNLAKSS